NGDGYIHSYPTRRSSDLILPDPIYKSKVVAKLINTIMLDGKKGIAQTIVYDAFDKVKDKTGKDALEVFESAMENITPQLEVKSRDRKSTRLNSSHASNSY